MFPQATAWQTTNEQVTQLAAGDTLSQWKPSDLNGHGEIFGVVLSVFIIVVLTLTYYFKIRRLPPNVAPNGYVLMIQIMIMTVRNFVVSLLGKRYEKMTPFFLMLITYITVANIIGIFGIAPPTSSLTVTFTFGFLMFFGMIYTALTHQRLSYLKSFFFEIKIKNKQIPYMLDPLKILGEITPLLSISIRLWGNIFSGVILTSMFLFLFQIIFGGIPVPILGPFLGSVFGGVLSTAIHFYFDVVVGIIQGIVFFMLSVLYWNMRKGYAEEQKNNKIESI